MLLQSTEGHFQNTNTEILTVFTMETKGFSSASPSLKKHSVGVYCEKINLLQGQEHWGRDCESGKKRVKLQGGGIGWGRENMLGKKMLSAEGGLARTEGEG